MKPARRIALALSLFALAGSLEAQTAVGPRRSAPVRPRFEHGWSERFDQGGLVGRVFAVDTYDGDLVAGGLAIQADNAHLGLVGTFDGHHWRQPGGGVLGEEVRDFAHYGSDLVAAGTFSLAGGQIANSVARFDGTQWHPLGDGLQETFDSPGPAFALAVYQGDVIVGGEFERAGGQSIPGIARWDGSQWHPIPGGVQGAVYALHVGDDGLLYVGGTFASAGGLANTQNVAAWDGSQWHALGSGLGAAPNAFVWDFATYQGEIWAAGNIEVAGGDVHEKVAIFDGSSWRAAGTFPDTAIHTIAYALQPYGDDLYIAGNFAEASGVEARRLTRWNGSGFEYVGGIFNNSINQFVFDMTVWDGRLVVGGEFNQVGTDFFYPDADAVITNSVGAFDGTTWSELGHGLGMNAQVKDLTAWNGGVIAMGSFSAAGNTLANAPAFLGGDAWRSLGAFGGGEALDAIEFEGDLVISGTFTSIDGLSIERIARFDGSTWSQLGGATPSAPKLALYQGDLYAVGTHLWHFDGGTWTQLGPQIFGLVTDLQEYAGKLYISRVAFNAGFVLAWDGQTLEEVPNGPDDTVNALVVHGGELVAGGEFQQVGGMDAPLLARWNGSSWSAVDTGLTGTHVKELAVLRGDLVASGNLFSPGQPPEKYLGRLTVRGWEPFDSGIDGEPITLAVDEATGRLWAGGIFSHAGGNISWYVGEWTE